MDDLSDSKASTPCDLVRVPSTRWHYGQASHLFAVREFVYVRRDASSRAFSRWHMRCAPPIRLWDHLMVQFTKAKARLAVTSSI